MPQDAPDPVDRLSGSIIDFRVDRPGPSEEKPYATAASPPADPGSARLVFMTDQPFPNHNGGHLVFGPDGKLYVTEQINDRVSVWSVP